MFFLDFLVFLGNNVARTTPLEVVHTSKKTIKGIKNGN